ncbi:type III pantothenate kinase [Pullulanibacillus pueri]|uniref:Type III pantothenate kinase n=1 Tax=Pullulanibacillus pueri TaxID=1437324 RepID=A0A8J2ZZT7_9BACL|nr:type III pantothenate kinase [Pullulanibacillus pueri]MBM7683957.1 type III pantothenate kinase [Pullulanibacillus pueri]GGH87972.1 type III pantothenate kinase [Pullulanibacillus pueri]
MIFVCDVGNTNIVLGIYKENQLEFHWRLETHSNKTEDEYAMIIKNLLSHVGLTFEDIEGAIISSVVPSLIFALERMCEKYFRTVPLVVGSNVEVGLKLDYANPNEIGADRIVNAVAAVEYYKTPSIVVDFGTATTFCYIDENENYRGGAIAPGVNISTEALYRHASKLPRVKLSTPEHVIGQSTVDAIQSGVVYGYVGLVEGIVGRMKQVSPVLPTVIATGGLASFIAKETDVFDFLDPFLTLKGLYLIYQKNKDGGR